MPAEWEPHESTWLAWPHYRPDWPGKFEPIPWVYAEIIRQLTRHEKVDLIVNDSRKEKNARNILNRANALSPNIRFHHWPTDRVWTRDAGCTFVVQKNAPNVSSLLTNRPVKLSSALTNDLSSRAQQESSRANDPAKSRDLVFLNLSAISWRFNAWAKYPNWKKDGKLASRMAKFAQAEEMRPMHGKIPIVLEGGSIDINGEGTLLTTEECLLSSVQQRNPHMTREDYERIFVEFLGIKKVIWLGKGIQGDDTHGHVDDLARFVAADTVVTMVEPNSEDPNHGTLQENLSRLKSASDQNDKPLRVIEIPMPHPVVFEGRRLPATYANFYIGNGVVLVPVFNDPNDRIALNTLAELFPTREVVGIYSGDLIWGFGAIHCMTQQQPAI
jgi:agmatine deiminase